MFYDVPTAQVEKWRAQPTVFCMKDVRFSDLINNYALM
jgi:hypothetical protein